MRSHISRVMVTGGAGFIGSHLLRRLVNEDIEALVLDNLSSGTRSNLDALAGKSTVKLFTADIKDRSVVGKLAGKVDAIVHLAALIDHETCLRNPKLANKTNGEATLMLLEEAERKNVKHFVYASTAAVYGETKTVPIAETSETSPISPYGASKLLGENHCVRYGQSHNLHVVCLRFFNVFGPRQTATQYTGVITEFMKRLNQKKPPIIFGDGLQSRDFVSVRDIVQSIMLAMASDASGIYNIATGRETTIESLARKLIELARETDLQPTHEAARQGDIRRSVADIRRAERELNYKPTTDHSRDLSELWKWYSSTHAIHETS